MTIASRADLKAALPGFGYHVQKISLTGKVWLSYFQVGSYPSAGAVATALGSGGDVPTAASAGALPLRNAGAGKQLYLYRFLAGCNSAMGMWLTDRCYEVSGFAGNITTTQTVVSPPALTRPDANGTGVEMWLELNTAWGGTATTVSVTYTNSANVGSHVATCTINTNQALNAGNMFPFSLQTGDKGVKSIQSLALTPSTGTAGNGSIILLRRIGLAAVDSWQQTALNDVFTGSLAKIDNDSCLYLFTENQSTAPTNGLLNAHIQIIEG